MEQASEARKSDQHRYKDAENDVLYNLAIECENLLDELQSTLVDGGFKLMTKLCNEFQHHFATWTANLGVFATEGRSLDKRLQKQPDLQNLAARLLEILQDYLQQAIEQANTENNLEATPETTYRTIEDTLNRLSKLGIKIRRSSRMKIESRAEQPSASVDLKGFTDLCVKAVLNLYPDTHQRLRDHLSNSMEERYARMLYTISRHEKANTGRDTTIRVPAIAETSDTNQPSLLGSASGALSSTETNQEANAVDGDFQMVSPREDIKPPSSKVTSIGVEWIGRPLRPPDEASTKLHKTSSLQVKQGNYPSIPMTGDSNDTFSCAWCFEPLLKRNFDDVKWRHHVNRDLKPYICVSQTCTESHPSHSEFDEWLAHMEHHGMQWYRRNFLVPGWVCISCGTGQEPFKNAKSLHSHLETSHGDQFTAEQIRVMSRQSYVEQRRHWRGCFFCGFSIEGQSRDREIDETKRPMKNPKQPAPKRVRRDTSSGSRSSESDLSDDSTSDEDEREASSHQQQEAKDRSRFMARHIAGHLEYLMLLTLRFASIYDGDQELQDDIPSNSASFNDSSDGFQKYTNSEKDFGILDLASDDSPPVEDMDNREQVLRDHENSDSEGIYLGTSQTFEHVPRKWDDLAPEDDEFLQEFRRSKLRSALAGNVSQDKLYSGDHMSKDEQCLQGLRLTDPQINKNLFQQHSGKLPQDVHAWISEHPTFKQWQHESEVKVLWIKGQPVSASPGPSRIKVTCAMMDEMMKSTQGHHLMSFFSCQDGRENGKLVSIFHGLISQLAHQQPSLIKYLRPKYDTMGKYAFSSDKNLFDILISMLQDPSLPETTLAIDSLDKCTSNMTKLVRLIQLTSWLPVKWLISSLDLSTTPLLRPVCHFFDMEELSDHIRISDYIRINLEELQNTNNYGPQTCAEIGACLTVHGHGDLSRIDEICADLKARPAKTAQILSLSANIDLQIDKGLRRIAESKDRHRYKCMLAIVVAAFRPLFVTELFDLNESLRVWETVDQRKTAMNFCCSFITTRSDTVYFVDPAPERAQRLSRAVIFPLGSHLDIFTANLEDGHFALYNRCMDLLQRYFDTGDNDTRKDYLDWSRVPPDWDTRFNRNWLRKNHGFGAFQYSCDYWISHLIDSGRLQTETRSRVERDVMEFLTNSFLCWSEALGRFGRVLHGLQSLQRLASQLNATGASSDLMKLIYDACRFMEEHQVDIESNAEQVHSSILASETNKSLIRLYYHWQ